MHIETLVINDLVKFFNLCYNLSLDNFFGIRCHCSNSNAGHALLVVKAGPGNWLLSLSSSLARFYVLISVTYQSYKCLSTFFQRCIVIWQTIQLRAGLCKAQPLTDLTDILDPRKLRKLRFNMSDTKFSKENYLLRVWLITSVIFSYILLHSILNLPTSLSWICCTCFIVFSQHSFSSRRLFRKVTSSSSLIYFR